MGKSNFATPSRGGVGRLLLDSQAIVRLYDYDKRSRHGKASLWWTLAEILAVVEGDGISPDSLLEVRLFKEYIKHVSNYAVNSCVEINLASMAWNLHVIEQTQSRGRRRVDGVGCLDI